MKKLTVIVVFAFCFISCTTDRNIQSDAIVIEANSVLVDYWNFNSTTGTLTTINPDFSLFTSGVSIKYPGTGAGYMDSFSPGYDTNSQNGALAGNGIRTRNPSDTRYLELNVPTTGFKKVLVQFATARSSSGATQQSYSYTIDGTNYTTSALAVTFFNADIDPLNALVSLDFRNIDGVNNNPNFKIRINFGGTNANTTSGNNRFDNVTLQAIPL